jgi:putative endopeptidase
MKYNGIGSIPGITCNGTLTLSENVADLGSAACVTQVVSQLENPDSETMHF